MNISGESSRDIISNFPGNLIESILADLPIRDAIRTSILSTKWKDKWVTMPHLIFNDNAFKGATIDSREPKVTHEVEVIKVISQILLQHNSPVLQFVLSISHLRSCPSIDHWLSYLSRNGIEDLTLEIQTAQSHKMPSSLFSCQNLRRLTLSNCIVRAPTTFSGFKNVRAINFKRVSCSAISLENIIVNSPLLKELTLFKMLDLHSLTINAPNLECLWFTGESESICSINTPRLVLLSLYIPRRSGLPDHGECNRSLNMVDFLGCFSKKIEQLHLNIYTSQFFAVGIVPNYLPNTYNNLWEIALSKFSFENLESVSCALSLIRNAPNLETIWMYIKTSTSPSVEIEPALTLMRANLESSVKLKKLESFKMTSMSGSKPEMEFIKFILATSPVLRKVTIKANRTHSSYNGFMTLKELVSFSRASSAAQIIYSDEEGICDGFYNSSQGSIHRLKQLHKRKALSNELKVLNVFRHNLKLMINGEVQR